MEHLIPSEWFIGQPQWALLALSAMALVILVRGADWLVEGASGIARQLGVPQIIVGATVVSLGTTSPECGVSVVAAWNGQAGLALGNAMGSIIADTGLIFGLGCILAVLPADRFVLDRQGWVQFGAGLLLAGLCYGLWIVQGNEAALGRWVGLLLLGLLVVYLYMSVRWARSQAGAGAESVDDRPPRPAVWLLASIVIGLVLVLLSSHCLVESMKELAESHWGVPKLVVASTLVAFGTSLPELVIGMTSVMRGHGGLLVGNVIGADVLNVLFVVGAAAVAAPLPILEQGSAFPTIALMIHLPVMLVILGLFRIFIARAVKVGSFRRWYGVPLVLIYVAYTVVQYVLTV